MASFHKQVALDGYNFEKFILTWKLASGITAADVGKAVSLDTGAANRVKLAADNDIIIGRLETYESVGQIGAVAHKFAATLPVKSGETVAVGNTVIGAGAGEVKAAGAAAHDNNIVVEMRSAGAVAVVVKL